MFKMNKYIFSLIAILSVGVSTVYADQSPNTLTYRIFNYTSKPLTIKTVGSPMAGSFDQRPTMMPPAEGSGKNAIPSELTIVLTPNDKSSNVNALRVLTYTADATIGSSCPPRLGKDACVELFAWNESNGTIYGHFSGAGFYGMGGVINDVHHPVVTERIGKIPG